MTVLVCAAHADDEVIGVGGTIAKLAEKGEEVVVVIFFYGVNFIARLTSWPILMPEDELIKIRVKESKEAGKILGVHKTIFLGMRGYNPELEFDMDKKKTLLNLIKKYNPDKVFFHSIKDGHRDHRFVNKVMFEILDELENKPEVYTYQINLFDFSERDPKVIYDVSKTYKKKFRALECFKSQILWTALLKPMILLKGIYFGKKHNMKFAEYFYPR